MVYVTRREVFSAAHKLYNQNISTEENRLLYGKCSNEFGHGHNYTMEVVIAGDINPDTGYVYDLKKLKKIILDNVINKVDHHNLNCDVDFMEGVIPTTENLVVAIWNQLADKIPSGKLHSIKIYETENNYVEYRG